MPNFDADLAILYLYIKEAPRSETAIFRGKLTSNANINF